MASRDADRWLPRCHGVDGETLDHHGESILKLDPSNAAALALKKQVEQTRKILG
jgi:hypothetical protein